MCSLLLRLANVDVIVQVTALCCSYKIYLLQIFILCSFIGCSCSQTKHFLLHSSRWRYTTLSVTLALYSIWITFFLNHSLNKEKRKSIFKFTTGPTWGLNIEINNTQWLQLFYRGEEEKTEQIDRCFFCCCLFLREEITESCFVSFARSVLIVWYSF